MQSLFEQEEVNGYDYFPPEEGSIDQYFGRLGSGKTYALTAEILDALCRGQVVYANWKINFAGYDSRNSWWNRFLGMLGLEPYARVIPSENFHYLNFRDEALRRTFSDWLANLTDASVYLDEGHQWLNSYEKTEISRTKQNAVAGLRHRNVRLVIASQRFMNIHVQARANVNRFFQCNKTFDFFGFKRFKVSELELTGEDTLDTENPIGVTYYWGRRSVYESYDTKYLRDGLPSSQPNYGRLVPVSWREWWQIATTSARKGKIKTS